jgi:succinate dehydrogenase / fumarate reductase flavoprotein subunit
LSKGSDAVSTALFEREKKRCEDWDANIRRMNGTENPYKLHQEMGEWMNNNVTVIRYNDRLKATDEKLCELIERYGNIGIEDNATWTNQVVPFTRHLWNMLQLSRAITLGALQRNESRGAHYKPDYPERDDVNWLKTTIACYTAAGPQLSYQEVDTSLIKPRPRRYDVDKAVVTHA